VTAALRQLVNGSLAAARPLPKMQARPPLSLGGGQAFWYFMSALCHAWRSLFWRDEWQVQYRPGPDSGYKNNDLAGFTCLPRLQGSFLADPFVIERAGRRFIFCEEYLFNEKRGIISCLEIKEGEPQGPPIRVLEKPYHLSYPFLIAEGDALYMIPESSAHNTVDLYRCTRFPDMWRLEATLLEGIKAVDATVALIGGKYWMFTAVKRAETRNFDELHLYTSPGLRGPWLPHPGNPLRFDVRAARPAGALFQDGDSWIRPAQDGTLRYGRRLSFERITALTESAYSEEHAGFVEAHDFEGVHTWNRAASLGVIDSVRSFSKFARLWPGMKKS
jgi:hypothetical protein